MTKGRSKRLIAARDKALCSRFLYWTETVRLRYDDTLKKLSEEEFFISEETIMCVLRRRLNGERTQEKRKPRKQKLKGIPFFGNG